MVMYVHGKTCFQQAAMTAGSMKQTKRSGKYLPASTEETQRRTRIAGAPGVDTPGVTSARANGQKDSGKRRVRRAALSGAGIYGCRALVASRCRLCGCLDAARIPRMSWLGAQRQISQCAHGMRVEKVPRETYSVSISFQKWRVCRASLTEASV
jgi:hypothetical protein